MGTPLSRRRRSNCWCALASQVYHGGRGDARGKAADTLYQAASLSKLVIAVAALRLVEQDRLALDRNIDDELTTWRLPDSAFTRGHSVTLRGLLSMTGGIGVPGYIGYAPGQPLPNLIQILDGAPPANSPPVRVEYAPGTRYAYSGGGYEIVQALIETRRTASSTRRCKSSYSAHWGCPTARSSNRYRLRSRVPVLHVDLSGDGSGHGRHGGIGQRHTLATALVRRAAVVYRWPPLGALPD